MKGIVNLFGRDSVPPAVWALLLSTVIRSSLMAHIRNTEMRSVVL